MFAASVAALLALRRTRRGSPEYMGCAARTPVMAKRTGYGGQGENTNRRGNCAEDLRCDGVDSWRWVGGLSPLSKFAPTRDVPVNGHGQGR